MAAAAVDMYIIDFMDINEYFCDVSELVDGQRSCSKHQCWFDEMDCFLDEYSGRGRKKGKKGKNSGVLAKAQRVAKDRSAKHGPFHST